MEPFPPFSQEALSGQPLLGHTPIILFFILYIIYIYSILKSNTLAIWLGIQRTKSLQKRLICAQLAHEIRGYAHKIRTGYARQLKYEKYGMEFPVACQKYGWMDFMGGCPGACKNVKSDRHAELND